MQLNRFDLNLLIALDALLREKNVTRAAERVFVSQPAMSAALQKLRAYFNDPLLVRVGRDMELTPKGLSLVEPVHEVLLRVQATLATQPAFDPGSARRSFSLVVASSALALLVPQLLDRIVRDAPGVQCHVDSLNVTSLSRLEYGDIDLCIAIDDPQFFGQRHWPEWLRSAALRNVRWACIADRDNALVDADLTLERYRALPHAVARAGAATELLAAPSGAAPAGLDVRATTESLLALPFMVLGTPLVASVPERLAQYFAARLPLKFVPDPQRRGEELEVVLWHKRREPDPAHAWFRQLVIDLGRAP
jgi:LysR family transcriptional regulator, nod-box dependent transcriptional activator